MNFREVRDKMGEIVASIRKDPHPAFIEIRTYRYRGHSMSDPASYRTKEELEKYPAGRSDHAAARAAHPRRKTD